MELPGFEPSWSAEFPNDNPALHDGASWLCLHVCGAPRAVTRPRPVNVRSDVPQGEVASSQATAASNPEAESAAIETGAVMSAQASAGWEEEGWNAGLDEDASRATSLEALTLSLEPEISPLADGHATSSQPLELDAMDFVTTLASDDVVFDFDGDDATGALPPVVLEPKAMFDVKQSAELAASEEAEPAATPDPFAAYVAAAVEVALATGHTRAAAVLPTLLEGAELDLSALTEDARTRLVAAGVLHPSDGGLRPSDAFSSTAAAWRSVLRGATSDFSACGDSTLDGWTADLLKALGVGQGTATDVRRELRRRGVAAFGMLLAA